MLRDGKKIRESGSRGGDRAEVLRVKREDEGRMEPSV